jgi:hypothetical protein
VHKKQNDVNLKQLAVKLIHSSSKPECIAALLVVFQTASFGSTNTVEAGSRPVPSRQEETLIRRQDKVRLKMQALYPLVAPFSACLFGMGVGVTPWGIPVLATPGNAMYSMFAMRELLVS